MSVPYDALLPQGHKRFVDRLGATMPETLPTTLAEDFASTQTITNTRSTGNPHLSDTGVLSRYTGSTEPQPQLLDRPPAFYTYHQFLNHITRSEVTMDYNSQEMGLCDPGQSPLNGWPVLQDTPETFHYPVVPFLASPQPGMPSAGLVSRTLCHHSVPHHDGVAISHGMNAQLSYTLTGTACPQSSPKSAKDHPTPSTLSFSDSDQQSNTVSFNEASDLIEQVSQPCDSPQSTYWCSLHPQQSSNHVSGVLESPKSTHTPPGSPPQPTDTTALKWMYFDPDMKSNKGKNKRKSKTPCPRCRKGAFENRHEFVKHMVAVHERPVKFVCNHRIVGENGEQYCCSRSEWHISAWAKHHTQRHQEICTRKQSQNTPLPECRLEIVEQRPVRQRGCWLCNHLSPTVEHWVDHHLSRHKACSRSLMSQTWAMKSLLSHPDITFYWQIQIRNLEVTTGYFWDLQWPKDPKDATMADLITCLETGFFRDKDFHKDSFVRAQVAEAAMDATIDTREKIAAIPPQQLLELQAGLNGLCQNLAIAARSEPTLSPDTRKVQHTVSSSSHSLYTMRGPVVPWLQDQWNGVDLYPIASEFDLGGPWTSHLDSEE